MVVDNSFVKFVFNNINPKIRMIIKLYFYIFRKCPSSCNFRNVSLNAPSTSLKRMYNDLDINCLGCKKTFKVGDIIKHENKCTKPKCIMHKICEEPIHPVIL